MADNNIPKYDPNAAPVVDINGIKKLLPHRPPFLMVDRITEIGEDYVVGIKTIGVNEGFFLGHFPEEPVMPGVLTTNHFRCRLLPPLRVGIFRVN